MKRNTTAMNESRRRLLGRSIGLGAVGMGVSAFGVAVAQQDVVADSVPQTRQSEYRETEHIRRYYRSAR